MFAGTSRNITPRILRVHGISGRPLRSVPDLYLQLLLGVWMLHNTANSTCLQIAFAFLIPLPGHSLRQRASLSRTPHPKRLILRITPSLSQFLKANSWESSWSFLLHVPRPTGCQMWTNLGFLSFSSFPLSHFRPLLFSNLKDGSTLPSGPPALVLPIPTLLTQGFF